MVSGLLTAPWTSQSMMGSGVKQTECAALCPWLGLSGMLAFLGCRYENRTSVDPFF